FQSGQTALMFAQGANAEDIAAETSRVFLGIQLQCANCHDHPTDKWTRREFHELAAYFPRMRIQQKQEPRTFEIVSVNAAPGGGRGGPGELFRNPERLFEQVDRNKDGKIERDEFPGDPGKQFFDRIVQRADTDKDGAISLAEMKALPPPPMGPRRGSTEHFMPDLEHPNEQGTRMEPVFFVDHSTPGQGVADVDRRKALATVMTAPSNPWFAKAFINRVWAELLGQGFYMPVDDLGPERSCTHPEVLDLLAKEFTARNYDIRWLFRTIANTEAYQRSLRPQKASETPAAFASASTTRLRADQLFDALRQTLGYQDVPGGRRPMGVGGGGRFGGFGRRAQFLRLFGFDPSTPFDEVTGTVPQALFLMNSRALHDLIRGRGQTPLARILNDNANDDDAISELYLLMLSREPSARESEIAQSYIKEVADRQEAFEDLQWSLLNSTEFLNKR
ncbi:MAG TPA: DUF1553 domain-containing protein, partial [Planctomycetaceae bacterium]|nr:DUF1553 domain-containing protein [Planctomycetaceae bacterium]